MAAELEELTKPEVWVDELAYTAEKGAPIQQVREFIMSLTYAPPTRRLRYGFQAETHQAVASATQDDLQAWASCQTPSVVRSLLYENETFLEITTLNFKSMFHIELQESEHGRHISGGTILHKFSFGHRV